MDFEIEDDDDAYDFSWNEDDRQAVKNSAKSNNHSYFSTHSGRNDADTNGNEDYDYDFDFSGPGTRKSASKHSVDPIPPPISAFSPVAEHKTIRSYEASKASDGLVGVKASSSGGNPAGPMSALEKAQSMLNKYSHSPAHFKKAKPTQFFDEDDISISDDETPAKQFKALPAKAITKNDDFEADFEDDDDEDDDFNHKLKVNKGPSDVGSSRAAPASSSRQQPKRDINQFGSQKAVSISVDMDDESYGMEEFEAENAHSATTAAVASARSGLSSAKSSAQLPATKISENTRRHRNDDFEVEEEEEEDAGPGSLGDEDDAIDDEVEVEGVHGKGRRGGEGEAEDNNRSFSRMSYDNYGIGDDEDAYGDGGDDVEDNHEEDRQEGERGGSGKRSAAGGEHRNRIEESTYTEGSFEIEDDEEEEEKKQKSKKPATAAAVVVAPAAKKSGVLHFSDLMAQTGWAVDQLSEDKPVATLQETKAARGASERPLLSQATPVLNLPARAHAGSASSGSAPLHSSVPSARPIDDSAAHQHEALSRPSIASAAVLGAGSSSYQAQPALSRFSPAAHTTPGVSTYLQNNEQQPQPSMSAASSCVEPSGRKAGRNPEQQAPISAAGGYPYVYPPHYHIPHTAQQAPPHSQPFPHNLPGHMQPPFYPPAPPAAAGPSAQHAYSYQQYPLYPQYQPPPGYEYPPYYPSLSHSLPIPQVPGIPAGFLPPGSLSYMYPQHSHGSAMNAAGLYSSLPQFPYQGSFLQSQHQQEDRGAIHLQQPLVVDLLQQLRKSKEDAQWARKKLAETIMAVQDMDRAMGSESSEDEDESGASSESASSASDTEEEEEVKHKEAIDKERQRAAHGGGQAGKASVSIAASATSKRNTSASRRYARAEEDEEVDDEDEYEEDYEEEEEEEEEEETSDISTRGKRVKAPPAPPPPKLRSTVRQAAASVSSDEDEESAYEDDFEESHLSSPRGAALEKKSGAKEIKDQRDTVMGLRENKASPRLKPKTSKSVEGLPMKQAAVSGKSSSRSRRSKHGKAPSHGSPSRTRSPSRRSGKHTKLKAGTSYSELLESKLKDLLYAQSGDELPYSAPPVPMSMSMSGFPQTRSSYAEEDARVARSRASAESVLRPLRESLSRSLHSSQELYRNQLESLRLRLEMTNRSTMQMLGQSAVAASWPEPPSNTLAPVEAGELSLQGSALSLTGAVPRDSAAGEGDIAARGESVTTASCKVKNAADALRPVQDGANPADAAAPAATATGVSEAGDLPSVSASINYLQGFAALASSSFAPVQSLSASSMQGPLPRTSLLRAPSSSAGAPSLGEIKEQFRSQREKNAKKLFAILMQTYPDMNEMEALSLAQRY